MDLFDIEGVLPSLTVLVERAKAAIRDVIEKGHPLVLAASFGKDSGVLLALAVEVLMDIKLAGGKAKLVVTSSDTLVESPEIKNHVRQESNKLLRYAKKHGLDVSFYLSRPNLSSTFQIKVLSGRNLPDYAGAKADCSVDWKIKPQQRLRNKLFKAYKKAGLLDPVTLIGTRYSESEKRALAMKQRGDNSLEPVRNMDGDLTLTPICRWTTDEVWTFIGEVAAGERETYTDFNETMRIYADAGGTSCAVVSDAILEGLSKQQKAGKCGARTGCWTCQQAYDKSLKTMVEGDPRYAYARGLVRFNEYLRAIRWDWSRRHYIGRTVKEGYLCIEPDTFHPAEIRRQTRMLLQLDHDEQERAQREGDRIRFSILPLEMMIALDALQSLHGVAKPYSIWDDLRQIRSGVRFDIPEIEPVKESPMPTARFLHVGRDWEGQVWNGLRDAYREGLLANSACEPIVGEDGLWDIDTEMSFDVDPEGAVMFEEFEMDYVLSMFDEGWPPGGITAGFKHYLGLGVLQMSHGQRKWSDEALRRTTLKDRLGLTLDYSLDEVLSMSVQFADMPPDARSAWKHKATTESAQTALF